MATYLLCSRSRPRGRLRGSRGEEPRPLRLLRVGARRRRDASTGVPRPYDRRGRSLAPFSKFHPATRETTPRPNASNSRKRRRASMA